VPRLLQSVSTLDELYKSFHEPRCRRAIHDIVVEGDCQIEHVARFDALLDDSWPASDATHDQEDRLPGGRQPQPPPRPAMPSAVTPTVPAAATRRVGSRRPPARISRINSRGSGKGIDIRNWNAAGIPVPGWTG
jgi:hypothetical protein